MKAFVTGGTGFIGSHVVRKLIARGYDVHALTRSMAGAERLEAAGAVVVPGDITDVASMRAGMAGSDVVFHLAAWYKVGAPDWMRAEAVNVGGTRKVLCLAHELGVPKIIYTSTIAVFGDTRGELVNETYENAGPFLTEYDRTKWLAHYKVAQPLIQKGAPIIIVMPGGVYGPGDASLIGQLMRHFYEGRMPAVLGPETTLTYAHVADVAEGHLLAAEKGKIGQSYILAGPAIPLGEMFDFWAYLTGKPAPMIHIPARLIRPFAPLVGALEGLVPLPEIVSREVVSILGVAYAARSDKARAELGWQTRSLQTGMMETFEWIAQTKAPSAPPVAARERKIAAAALGTAFFLILLYWLSRKRQAAG